MAGTVALERRDFVKLWLGQTISQIGSVVTRDALPLTAVITLSASPLQMGLLGAAGTAPVLVVGLFAGVWADRVRRRPILIAADLARAALLCTIPAAAALGTLHIAQLYLVAALAGVLTVFFDVAYRSYLPSLLPPERLLEANGRLGAGESLAELSGAPLAGVLVQTLSGPTAVLLDSLSFLCSAASLGAIRRPEPAPSPRDEDGSALRDVRDGLRCVWAAPLLRSPAAALATISLFGNIIGATYYLYAVRTLGIGPALLGLIVACGGAGAFPGSLLAAPLSRRFGAGPTMLLSGFLGGVLTLSIPLAHRPVVLAAALLAAGQVFGDLLRAVYMANDVSLRQAVAPSALLGRVTGTVHVVSEGMTPLGLLGGGLLAQALGLRPALYIAAGGLMAATLWLAASPVRTQTYPPVPP